MSSERAIMHEAGDAGQVMVRGRTLSGVALRVLLSFPPGKPPGRTNLDAFRVSKSCPLTRLVERLLLQADYVCNSTWDKAGCPQRLMGAAESRDAVLGSLQTSTCCGHQSSRVSPELRRQKTRRAANSPARSPEERRGRPAIEPS